MKRLLSFILMATVLVACTDMVQPEPIKEPTQQTTNSKKIPVTFKASKCDSLITKALSLNNITHTLNVKWIAGEKVLVGYLNTPIGELTAAASNNGSTTLSGYIDMDAWQNARNESEAQRALYFYLHPIENSEEPISTNYVGQDGTLTTIGSRYDYCLRAEIPANGYSVNNGLFTFKNVDAEGNASLQFGANLQAIVKFKLLDDNNNPISLSSFNVSTMKEGNYTLVRSWDPKGGNPVFTYFDEYWGPMTVTPIPTSEHGVGELFVSMRINTDSDDLSSDILLSATTSNNKFYYYQKPDVTLEPGKYYEITVKMKQERAISLTNATSFDVGKVIGADGKIYTNVTAAEAAGTTAVALLAYVGRNTGEGIYTNGLAIALNDWGKKKYRISSANLRGGSSNTDNFPIDGGLKYSIAFDNNSYPAFWTAQFMCPVPVPDGCSDWFLPTGHQWKRMIAAFGGYANFRDAFSGVGGSNLTADKYWTSTQRGLQDAWCVNFSGTSNLWQTETVGNEIFVRPVFAFYCEHPQGLRLESVNRKSIGKVIGQNGLVYDSAAHASAAGTNAVAMITYLGSNTGEAAYDYTLGLAVALNDCSNSVHYSTNTSYENATLVDYTASPTFSSESGLQYIWEHWTSPDFDSDWPAFYTVNALNNVPGCSRWFIGTGYQWSQMISFMQTAGKDMPTAFENVGGTNLQGDYWLSTMTSQGNAWTITFGDNISWGYDEVTQAKKVRPILAFYCEEHKDMFMPLGKSLDQVDQSSLGKLIGADGLMYDSTSDAEESGTSAVAMIAYVGEYTGESSYYFTRGLAISLHDAKLSTTNSSKMNYYGYTNSYVNEMVVSVPDQGDPEFSSESGIQYMDAHHNETSFASAWPAFYAAYNYTSDPVPGCSMWFIGTGYQWVQMMTAMSDASKDLFAEFDERGIGSMPEGKYWLSTMSESKMAWYYNTEDEEWGVDNIKTSNNRVRPILAF